jgi:hypothetical protein
MSATLKTTQLEFRQKIHRRFGWTIVRSLVAVILFIAAILKSMQLAASPDLGEGLFHARGLNIAVVEFELAFGIWLLSGLLQKTAWFVSLILFIGFAGVSFYKAAILQENSCGCFGAAQVNPWITMTLDLTIVGLLTMFRPKEIMFHWQTFFQELVGLKFNKRFFAAAGIWFVVVLPVTYAMFSVQKNETTELGTELIGINGKKTISLKPQRWIGKTLPILSSLELKNKNEETDFLTQLKDGEWFIVFYRSNCPKCKKLLSELSAKQITNVVSVEVLQDGKTGTKIGIYDFRLNDEYDWFCQPPILIQINTGGSFANFPLGFCQPPILIQINKTIVTHVYDHDEQIRSLLESVQ